MLPVVLLILQNLILQKIGLLIDTPEIRNPLKQLKLVTLIEWPQEIDFLPELFL